ncbi:MAG: hypothetical protein ACK5ZT_13895, partial [Sphingobacteriaceae bacterium]
MFVQLTKTYKQLLTSSNHRTAQVKKNIVLSIFIKGFNTLTNIFLVPLTLEFVTPAEYGIWVTLS